MPFIKETAFKGRFLVNSAFKNQHMKKIILAGLLAPLFGIAQNATYGSVVKYNELAPNSDARPAKQGTALKEEEPGIHFVHGLSWKDVQAKAKAENKYIVMDCFTTWCGPCTMMSKTIFPLKEVGDFFNANYVAVKVQFDTTKNDNDEVKAWYKDMEDINAKYKIRAYPTYLIFDPNGNVVHRAIGYNPDPQAFINKGREGMNPEKQYYTLLKKYENGEKSPAFLRNLATVSQDAYDMANAKKIAAEYAATQTDLYTKENLEFVGRFTNASTDPGFKMMLANPEKVDAVLGKGKSADRIAGIVMQEEIYPVVLKRAAPGTTPVTPDFDALHANLASKYPDLADELTQKGKLMYYQRTKDWNNFQTEVVSYMNRYGAKATPADLNSYAWTVFENCKDMTCVTEALEWSKRSFREKENGMFIDTYANILYKLGKTQEGIQWEEKALALAADSDKASYQATLDKMKKGEKTWKD